MTNLDQRIAAPATDVRTDPYLGTVVHVVASRQSRPNLPSVGCPFCVGGLEAPEPYDVRSFPNRWPALGEGRCEVVLYTPDHDATFASLGACGARRVISLWIERTAALAALPGVEFVMVFENRGAEIGATIPHPHGQIYAFDHVPARPLALLEAGWSPDPMPGERIVIETDHWQVWVPVAAVHPLAVTIAPKARVADLGSASGAALDDLAAVLVDVFDRLDRLFDVPLPYMMWMNQTLPAQADRFTEPWFHIEIVSPWRSAGLHRFIAGVEVGTGEYFNPVSPEGLAGRLRELG